MPRAGWCRECGEWVWVDEEGGCQFGHEPECVDGIHEQDDPGTSETLFGHGPLPVELYRFNWGAFFLPLFWGAAYGSWPIIGAWVVAVFSPLAISVLAGAGEGAAMSVVVGATVASELVTGLARLWAGANANRLLWAREQARLELVPAAHPRFSVTKFSARQRTWTLWGAIIAAVGSLVLIPVGAQVWREYGLTYIGALMPLVWLLAEVFLGFWLDVRMRQEPSDLERAKA